MRAFRSRTCRSWPTCRRLPGIRVSILGDRAWICWDAESESTRQMMIERLLPLSGVEMFARHGGHWYRPGEHLPAFRVPIGDGSGGVSLERSPVPQADDGIRARERRAGTAGAATGARRAESTPAGRRGVLPARSAGPLGRAGDLGADRVADGGLDPRPGRRAGAGRGAGARRGRDAPGIAGRSRFWGMDVMIPLGFRADPELSESALRRLVGAGPDDLVVLDAAGYERIPRAAFRPLSRAGIRLAMVGLASGRHREGRAPAMNHRRAALYLQIPDAYCRSFGGLRWAQRGEAVEFLGGPDAGRTFAFAAEIARFLEGLLTPGKSILAFGCVLHILYLIGLGERAQGHGSIHRLRRINEPFRDLRSPLAQCRGAVRLALPRDPGRRRSARADLRPGTPERRELDSPDGPLQSDARDHGLRRAARAGAARIPGSGRGASWTSCRTR